MRLQMLKGAELHLVVCVDGLVQAEQLLGLLIIKACITHLSLTLLLLCFIYTWSDKAVQLELHRLVGDAWQAVKAWAALSQARQSRLSV